MKITRMFYVLTVCLGVLTSASFAQNLPLRQPLGLAVDASGNLYVANHNANNILIYNSSYVQQTSETITSGIKQPTGLQIDPYGNLWVANYAQSNGGCCGSITEYTNLAMQSGNTVINGIAGPQNIAFDGLANLYVNNNGSNLTVYTPTGVGGPPSSLAQTINISNLWAVGEAAGVVYTGATGLTCLDVASTMLVSGSHFCDKFQPYSVAAFAADNNGGLFAATNDANNDVVYFFPGGNSFGFVSLPFTNSFNESGMAVDNVRHRLYVSDRAANKILVYSLASGSYGTLIHAIHN
jgi:sugar lactone lactonase YvrE